jgi:hypothetical protein
MRWSRPASSASPPFLPHLGVADRLLEHGLEVLATGDGIGERRALALQFLDARHDLLERKLVERRERLLELPAQRVELQRLGERDALGL